MTGALPPQSPCLVCGTPRHPGDTFCASCGSLLPDPEPTAPDTQTLDLEQLFVHDGRIGRAEYLCTAFVLNWFLIVALGLMAAMSGNIAGLLLGAVLAIAAAVALTCAVIKRLHDMNTTGWLAVVAFVPFIGWGFMLVLALIGSTRGQNSYGLPQNGSVRPRAS